MVGSLWINKLKYRNSEKMLIDYHLRTLEAKMCNIRI